MAGGLSGLVEWTLFMATDTVKTRAGGGGAGRVVRKRVADALAVRGAARLLPGYGPVVLRAVPVNATSFFVIEAANRRIREFRARR